MSYDGPMTERLEGAACLGEGEPLPTPTPLSPAARFLLWDYDRGSLPYDVLWLLLLLALLIVPASWWRDPLRSRHASAPWVPQWTEAAR